MENVQWKDKKRIMGQPISFTTYYIKDNKFYCENGIIQKEVDIIMLYRVIDLKMKQSLIQRLFKVGNVILLTNDKTHSEFIIENVQNPGKLLELLSELIEIERKRQGIRTTEVSHYGTELEVGPTLY